MAASEQDRIRASRLRKRRAAGKPLAQADVIWLADYEKRHGAGKTGPKPGAAADKARAPATVRGPQLGLVQVEAAAVPVGAHVHATAPETTAAPESTWVPTMPAAPAPELDDGSTAATAEAAAGGPRPAAGTPLVEPSTPTGDPVAAQQMAKLVQFFVYLGMQAGRELLDDVDAVPVEVKAMLMGEAAQAEALSMVGASAERLAMKWGLRSVPMGDEAIVGIALVGSAAAIAKNAKRKLAAEKTDGAGPEKKTAPVVQTQLDGLWNS